MTRMISLASAAALAIVCGSAPAGAQLAGQGYGAVPSKHAMTPALARGPRSYYPERIEGGSAGNLPFNNQIRKFKDPLNANGGR